MKDESHLISVLCVVTLTLKPTNGQGREVGVKRREPFDIRTVCRYTHLKAN